MDDLISRQEAIDALFELYEYQRDIDPTEAADLVRQGIFLAEKKIEKLPSAQPFHNITMDDVLKYIDRMPEDVWQEFTACLECRGWELQRRTAKWCGSEFA